MRQGQKVWLITGISSGIGKALFEEVSNTDDFIIGTFRNAYQADNFNAQNFENAFAIHMDMSKPDSINKGCEIIINKFNKLDVLVNDAGFGFAGAIEETSLQEAKSVFDVNFFAAFQILKNVLPLFRKQRAGHIIQMSSHGGFKAVPGFGIYNASKFAIEGLSEALAAEIAPLGIKLTIVEPGPFRTNFAGNSLKQASLLIQDYHETAGLFRQKIKQSNGMQEGDPVKAAIAIIQLANSQHPPLRLPLGKIALGTIKAKIESVQRDLEAGQEIALHAVYNS